MFLVFPLQDFVITSRLQYTLCPLNFITLDGYRWTGALVPIFKALSYQLVCPQFVVFKNPLKKKKITIPLPSPELWLYCFVHVYVGHIASHGKPTLCGCEITTYKTSLKTSSYVLCHPASECNYVYHNILILKKEKPANSCLSIEECTQNFLCCETMRTDHL